MRYDGTIKVAMHAPAGMMIDLDAVLQEWMEQKPKDYVNRYVREDWKAVEKELQWVGEICQKQPADEMVTMEWEYFSNIALVVLDFIDGIAHLRPEIALAVTMAVNFSVTDTSGYFSYYSPAGANSILKEGRTEEELISTRTVNGVTTTKRRKTGDYSLEDFIDWENHACNSKMTIPLSAVDVHGKKHVFDLLKVKDLNKDIFDRWQLDAYDVDMASMEVEEGRGELLFQLSPQGVWRRMARWFYPDGCEEIADDVCQLEEQFDGEYDFEEFFAPVYDDEVVDYPDEFVLGIFHLLLPDTKISIQTVDGAPHYLDEQGNEYFFGNQTDFDEWDIKNEIDWGFPPEADWVPFGKPKQDKKQAKKESLGLQEDSFEFTPVEQIEFQNKIFVLTGFGLMEPALKQFIANRGGEVKDSLVAKANYLLVDPTGGEGLTNKYLDAVERNKTGKGKLVAILSFETFLQLTGMDRQKLNEEFKNSRTFAPGETFLFTPVEEIIFPGKNFVLTGFGQDRNYFLDEHGNLPADYYERDTADREEEEKLEQYITDQGGVIRSSTVLKTDYLIVQPNCQEKTDRYLRALELNEKKGKDIKILSVETFYQLSGMKKS